MDEAIHPDAPYLGSTPLDESEIVETEVITEALEIEKEMASLLSTKGWQRISAKMQQDIDSLRTGEAILITKDMPMEEVGRHYIVAKTVAENLQVYLDMVNGAADATREYERRKNSESTGR